MQGIKMKRFILLALSLCFCLSDCMSSPAVADVPQPVAEVMEHARKNGPMDLKELVKAPLREVLAALHTYVNDPSKDVRMEAAAIASSWATRSSDRVARRQAAQLMLIIADTDPEAGLARWASERLSSFLARDFTDEMKQTIHDLLLKDRYDEDIRLAGVAEVWSAEETLRELAKRDYWSAHLALARMGHKTEIQYVVEKVGTETDAAKKVLRTQDLAYIRQPEAVALLVEWLFRDDAIHTGNGTDVLPTLYAAHALGQLTGIIEDIPFPYYQGSGAYSMAEIEQARAWVMQRGVDNLKIKR
jgi:hypothetical protein